jgi:uncharacterized protein YndB with AHSA1/START domain
MPTPPFDPNLDLQIEHTVDISPELIWKAWTTPALIEKWFAPLPWTTKDCEMELWPGGAFRCTMCEPEGMEFPYEGCILEVVENQRLVWTSGLGPGFRPVVPGEMFPFTAIITLEPAGQGTKYTAAVVHADAESRKKHEEMGFHQGWSVVLTQLVALMKEKG